MNNHCLPVSVLWVNRAVLFIIFFWFGFLKILGLSPAEQLVTDLHYKVLAPYIAIGNFLPLLGFIECAIGLLWLIPSLTRFVLAVFLLQMVTTFLPLFILPADTWTSAFVLTLSGQYIIKNIVLIACAFTVYKDCQIKGWKISLSNLRPF